MQIAKVKDENTRLMERLKIQERTYKFELLKPIIFYKGMNDNNDTIIFNAAIMVDNILLDEKFFGLKIHKNNIIDVSKSNGVHEIRVKKSEYPKLVNNKLTFSFLDETSGRGRTFDCEWPGIDL
jgi:hypothetical protein